MSVPQPVSESHLRFKQAAAWKPDAGEQFDIPAPLTRRFLLERAAVLAGGALLPAALRGQATTAPAVTAAPSPSPIPSAYPQPATNPYPYSGVSGAGFPVTTASAHGGWRSGSSGVAYQGEHPYPFPTLPWDNYSTGSAVTNGILPAIRPLIDVQVRDTIVCHGGDGNFYMTGSTGENIWAYNRGVELWKSPDLVKWTYLGLVWDMDKEGTWEKPWRDLHGKPCRAIWAPELHFLRNNYYICLSIAPTGISILKSTSGKPEGPYVHAFSPEKPIVNGIDPTLFEDTDGKVYFTYASATKIARLKDDLSGLAEDYHPIVLADPDHTPSHHAERCVGRGMNDLGTEGAVLFKANGRYYLGAADSYEGRYSTCLAISDNIYGPYHTRHEPVPCGGGTCFFQDNSGGWWSSYFGNDTQSPFREKPAIVKVDFAPEGKIYVAAKQPFIPTWKPKPTEAPKPAAS
jgi:xylan 1,4-beta-xylosidase